MTLGTIIGIASLLLLALGIGLAATAKRADEEAEIIARRLADIPSAEPTVRIHSIAIERHQRRLRG